MTVDAARVEETVRRTRGSLVQIGDLLIRLPAGLSLSIDMARWSPGGGSCDQLEELGLSFARRHTGSHAPAVHAARSPMTGSRTGGSPA